jgi:O-antigen ligase
MAIRILSRSALTSMALVAMAETRTAVRATPAVIRALAPAAGWAAASIILGVVVGFAAVILPPMGAFGIVGILALILLWVMPELPLVYPGLIRKTFYLMLIAGLCIPIYYTVQFGGLPWISVRRVATFALIVPFFMAIASSSEVRHQIAERLRSAPLILVCVTGFLIMVFLSIFTSELPQESTSAFTEVVLTWYVPFLAAIYVVKSREDSVLILKIICFCSVFNAIGGVWEFRVQRRIFVDIFPKSMLDSFIEANPTMAAFLDVSMNFRNGLYRAASTFMTPLSFGEFEIMVIPIGLFLALHREKFLERALGWATVIGGMAGIYVSGSRGGYVGFLVSMAVFVAAWAIRKARISRVSLAPAFVGASGVIGFGAVIGLINVWHTAHDMVMGGGTEQASTDARWVQWYAALPLIKTNPITGHGFATGGADIAMSIDSFITSLILETGFPGFAFFFGTLCLVIWFGLRSYIFDLSEWGAIAGAIACSFVAFFMYRLALSQKENGMLEYVLLAVVNAAIHEHKSKHVEERERYGPQRRPYHRAPQRELTPA